MKNPLDSDPQVKPSEVSDPGEPQPRPAARGPYEKPQVVDHGRLADIALGGSPGTGDSGLTDIERPPGT